MRSSLPKKINSKKAKKKALIIVDIQNDFLPGGSLAVKDGNKIFPVLNQLEEKDFDLIVATKDWHPSNHGSFASQHGKKVGSVVDLFGRSQILWPDHCVQGSQGADFGRNFRRIDKIIHKGIDPKIDSYSTFFDNGHLLSTGLEEYLRKEGIEEVYFAGLTTDYCVKYSALDAIKLGFQVFVIEDGCKAVNLEPHDGERALKEMHDAGVHILRSTDLTKNH